MGPFDLVTNDPALRRGDQAGGRVVHGLELAVSPGAVPAAGPVGGLAHGRGQQFGVGRHEIGQRAGLQLGGPLYVDVEVAQPLAPAGFTRTQAKGDHEKWTLRGCHVVIPHARDISPGVVRQVLKAIGRSTS